MLEGSYTVWTWLNTSEEVVYVGWGKTVDGVHPADRLYIEAQRELGLNQSSLSLWLGCHEKAPKRIDHGRWGKAEARMLANARRERFRREGCRLLSSKPFAKCVGGGKSRGVRAPNGTIYGSVRVAADHYEVNPSTILRWCVANDGWSYVDPETEK